MRKLRHGEVKWLLKGNMYSKWQKQGTQRSSLWSPKPCSIHTCLSHDARYPKDDHHPSPGTMTTLSDITTGLSKQKNRRRWSSVPPPTRTGREGKTLWLLYSIPFCPISWSSSGEYQSKKKLSAICYSKLHNRIKVSYWGFLQAIYLGNTSKILVELF